MIYTLPKSLIEAANTFLKQPKYPTAYISFRDVDSADENSHMVESELPKYDEWEGKNENSRTVHNHLNLDSVHTDDDKTHVYRYTAASTPLNKKLYADHKAGIDSGDHMEIKGAYNFKHDLKGIDAAVNRNKLDHDLVSYSGVSWNPKDKVDGENHVHLPAYTSTSLNKGIAYTFAKSGKKTPEPGPIHILRIKHPAGSTGFYTHDDPAITHFDNEQEYVVPRNTTIHIHPTPEVYGDKHGNQVHVWNATRVRTQQVDTGYQTPDARTELHNKNGLKIYRTDSLAAYRKHYSDFYSAEHGADFHQHHVISPVFHVHTPDNTVWQSSLEDGGTIFRPKHGKIKGSLDSLIKNHPEIAHLKDTLTRKDKEYTDNMTNQAIDM